MNKGIIMKKLAVLLSLSVIGLGGSLCAMERDDVVSVNNLSLTHRCNDFKHTLLLELKEKPVGMIVYNQDQEDKSFSGIEHLFVDEKFRKKGIEESLVGSACVRLKKLGCTTVDLQVRENNSPARAFYEKLGFKKDEFQYIGGMCIYSKEL